MTFEEALDLRLKKLDSAYTILLALHADPLVVNETCPGMREAWARMNAESAKVFLLKQAWNESKDCQL